MLAFLQLVAGFGRCSQRRVEGWLYNTKSGRDNLEDEPFCAVPGGFGHRAYEPNHGAARRNPITAGSSALAIVPEIDHRIGQGLECVVELTEAIKTKQQSPEFVFPSKHAFNRREAFLKDRQLKEQLAASLGLLSHSG
jgi:hypothetical protein